jgi:hypothetical protein
MTDQVRRAAAALLREEADAAAEQRARVAERRVRARLESDAVGASTITEAGLLLPEVMERFGDTACLQARRRDALEAEILYQDRAVRRRTKEAFLARQEAAA